VLGDIATKSKLLARGSEFTDMAAALDEPHNIGLDQLKRVKLGELCT